MHLAYDAIVIGSGLAGLSEAFQPVSEAVQDLRD
jgi:succinate dehydrogenase/fumarate reductase flavoprotein subunit